MRPCLEDYATIEAYVNDVPVYAFGYTYVYGASPDLLPGVRMQDENTHPVHRLKLKKSWEIEHNYCGSTPAREPKTMWNDDQPLLPVHLIDGDSETAWSSRGMATPGVQPEWIRIDLPAEAAVAAVALVCCEKGPHPDARARVGKSLPQHLTVRLSRDGKTWETVYEGDISGPDSGPTMVCFEPRRAKMVWIIGGGFGSVGNWGYSFSIGQLEVRDPTGANLALISRGAGVQVSSTYYGYGMDRFTQDMLWPLQYDLGFKWTRVGYDMGQYLWSYVERDKGRLEIDRKADKAVTEAHDNGVHVILCLDKGNWLYREPARKTDWKRARIREMMETYYDHQGWPHESPELLEGYLRYVDYMVRHFKGRVAYFEICNEWSDAIGMENYLDILHATIPVIKKADPGARILLGSVNPAPAGGIAAEPILRCLGSGTPGLATQIDAVGFHPWYHPDVDSAEYRRYRSDFEQFKQACEGLGFAGEYIASEWAFLAPYPLPSGESPEVKFMAEYHGTEMQKAKYSARLMTAHAGMGIVSLFNETFQTGRIERDVTLLRNSSFQFDPITPSQPQAAYYVLRNLSTMLDGCEPAEFPVECSGADALDCYTFRRRNGDLVVSAWIPGKTGDGIVEKRCDIFLPGVQAERARAADAMNGTEQELNLIVRGGATVLEGIRIKDYPVLIRIEGGKTG